MLQLVGVDADGLTQFRLDDEGAETLARVDNAVGTQAGDGLTHDIAADLEGLCQLVLGRQPIARPEPASSDLPGDHGGDLLVQGLGASHFAEPGFAEFGIHRRPPV